MKFTPNYGWPIAEDTDVVKQYPTTIDEPFKMALDASPVGAACYVRGSISGAAAGGNLIPLDTIMFGLPAGAWTIVNGDLIAPWDGEYQVITSGTTMGMWQGEAKIYSDGGIVAELETQTAGMIGAFSAAIAHFMQMTAGAPFLKPQVLLSSPGGQLIGNLAVIYLGKH